ncbi:response regulator [Neptunicoccus sediminis]|uniref:response regulator n=1 Tax=Neptunicoccus sediminis TaxID=1892596 RepID=UPI0008461D87|nr:response regulator [Neptunicoccus sediminis]
MAVFEKILHVEDDADIREIAKIALEMIGGLDVHQCASGHDAIAIAEEYAPDLILLDVMMPVIGGEETLRELRKNPALDQVPAVFMTAKAHQKEKQALLDQGAVAVIVKPFDPTTLADEIRAIWEAQAR